MSMQEPSQILVLLRAPKVLPSGRAEGKLVVVICGRALASHWQRWHPPADVGHVRQWLLPRLAVLTAPLPTAPVFPMAG
jgi:hypothetical protein